MLASVCVCYCLWLTHYVQTKNPQQRGGLNSLKLHFMPCITCGSSHCCWLSGVTLIPPPDIDPSPSSRLLESDSYASSSSVSHFEVTFPCRFSWRSFSTNSDSKKSATSSSFLLLIVGRIWRGSGKYGKFEYWSRARYCLTNMFNHDYGFRYQQTDRQTCYINNKSVRFRIYSLA